MDPQNNPDMILGPQMADLMAQLATAMAKLANVNTMQLASNLSKAKAIQKPSPFKGEQGSDT